MRMDLMSLSLARSERISCHLKHTLFLLQPKQSQLSLRSDFRTQTVPFAMTTNA